MNLTSAWWMENTQHIVRNALLEVPHPNVSIMQRCDVFPVEVVVRGFMTGMPPQIRPKAFIVTGAPVHVPVSSTE